jgi:hypothetical protein
MVIPVLYILVYKFNDNHGSAISLAIAGFDQTGVTALTFTVTVSQGTEQFLYDIIVHYIGTGLTAGMQVSSFAQSNHFLSYPLYFFASGFSGSYLFML